MAIGDNIKQKRIDKGLTQKQLGELCKPPMADSAIRRYENGNANPKLETVRRISDALDVFMSDLIDDWSMFSQAEIYEDWSDKEVDHTALDPRAAAEENRILEKYRKLNKEGQNKATEYVSDLEKIPAYQKGK